MYQQNLIFKAKPKYSRSPPQALPKICRHRFKSCESLKMLLAYHASCGAQETCVVWGSCRSRRSVQLLDLPKMLRVVRANQEVAAGGFPSGSEIFRLLSINASSLSLCDTFAEHKRQKPNPATSHVLQYVIFQWCKGPYHLEQCFPVEGIDWREGTVSALQGAAFRGKLRSLFSPSGS